MNLKADITLKNQRLDVALLSLSLAGQIYNLSSDQPVKFNRSQIKKMIDAGQILVDGATVKSGFKLKGGEDISISMPEASTSNFNLPIIYEDENVIVFNKPSGMLTHAKGGFINEQTVVSVLQPKTIKLEAERSGIVHRLDRDTSGVIICAKNPEAKSFLMRQFSDRKAKKTYFAIIEGIPKLDAAKLDWPIARNPKQLNLFRVSSEGKPAQTNYQVLSSNENLSLVELKPVTGRTHQLRVHMLELGCPIVGDRFYNQSSKLTLDLRKKVQSSISTNPVKSSYSSDETLRLMLHASSLEITIPGGIRKNFKANLPNDFTDFMNDNSLKHKNEDVAQ